MTITVARFGMTWDRSVQTFLCYVRSNSLVKVNYSSGPTRYELVSNTCFDFVLKNNMSRVLLISCYNRTILT